MKLVYGTEKRFSEFVSGLNEKDKIALLSHNDADGVVAAFVTDKVIKSDLILFCAYSDLNDGLIDRLQKEKITKVVMTDLFIKDPEFFKKLEKFASILVIDHHLAESDFNSSKTTYLIVEPGYCAAYMAYELFSRISSLEKYDWLVAAACVADYCHIKVADWLTNVYSKYGDKFEIVDLYVRKDGAIWNIQNIISLALIYCRDDIFLVYNSLGSKFGDLGKLSSYASEVDEEINLKLEEFKRNKENFKGGYFWMFNPNFGIAGIMSNIVSGQEPNKTYIIARVDGNRIKMSLRRQDKKEDMNALSHKLIEGFDDSTGGGHFPAAGASIPLKYLPEFRKRLGLKA